MHHPDVISQLIQDRQRERIADAAVHRLVPSSPARTRLARSLRRAADRIDAAAVSPPPVRSAIPGGGC